MDQFGTTTAQLLQHKSVRSLSRFRTAKRRDAVRNTRFPQHVMVRFWHSSCTAKTRKHSTKYPFPAVRHGTFLPQILYRKNVKTMYVMSLFRCHGVFFLFLLLIIFLQNHAQMQAETTAPPAAALGPAARSRGLYLPGDTNRFAAGFPLDPLSPLPAVGMQQTLPKERLLPRKKSTPAVRPVYLFCVLPRYAFAV